MNLRNVILGLLAAGMILFANAPLARADYKTLTYTFDNSNGLGIPMTQTDWGPNTNFSTTTKVDPFVVPLFDPTKNLVNGQNGALIGVGINLHYEFNNTITMRFDNLSTINVKAAGVMHLYGPDGKTDMVNAPGFNTGASASSSPSDVFSKSVTLPTLVVTSDSGKGYTDASTLKQFTGAGAISLPAFATATSSFVSSSGNGQGTSVTTALATLTITYYFVPEPSSVILTGLGISGLLLGAYRANSRKTRASAAVECETV